jgi:type IV pilus assembly protein PilV
MLNTETNPMLREKGFSLLEVLITLLIVSVGLLGLAGLHARSLVAESESHAKGQALALLQDIAQRLESNPTGTQNLITTNTSLANIGNGYTCIVDARLETDLCEWDAALKATKSVPGAIGCVQAIAASSEILLSVAWQGRDSGFAPSAAQSCGSASIPSGRRVVSMRIRRANLGA